MHNKRRNKAENVKDDSEDRSQISNLDDELSLHASSQDSFMNEILYEGKTVPTRDGESVTEDDDVIIVSDSPRKAEPRLPTLEKIEEAVKNLKNAFLQGEKELSNILKAINHLKEKEKTVKELPLKRSPEDGIFEKGKRAKVEKET